LVISDCDIDENVVRELSNEDLATDYLCTSRMEDQSSRHWYTSAAVTWNTS